MYYLVGFDRLETQFRVLKIDRRVEKPRSLLEILREDPCVYTREQITDMIRMINEGHTTSGGMKKIFTAVGLVGFVKFLDCYYFTLIKEHKLVGRIGANNIYTVKATETFAVKPSDSHDEGAFSRMWRTINKKLNQTTAEVEESRYMSLFQQVDMSKDFYFSYTYDLTHYLQHNFIMSKQKSYPPPPTQEIFEWNNYQIGELRTLMSDSAAANWVLPVIQGFFQQKRFSLLGRNLDVSLIARRSRHYAGTRYLKRGISVQGKVANDCEVEQILQVVNVE